MTETIAGMVLRHGERGNELDPFHPEACLCGAPFYLHCVGYLSDEDGFLTAEFSLAPSEPTKEGDE
jgi:hypothetical protein